MIFLIEVIKKDKKKVITEIEAVDKEEAVELCKKWYGENSILKVKEKK